jgi:tetratricopeptide (TPR) repeat protein
MGNYEKAEEMYDYIIDLNKAMIDAYLLRAKNRICLGHYKEAKSDLNTAIEINPAYRAVIELDEELKEIINGNGRNYR